MDPHQKWVGFSFRKAKWEFLGALVGDKKFQDAKEWQLRTTCGVRTRYADQALSLLINLYPDVFRPSVYRKLGFPLEEGEGRVKALLEEFPILFQALSEKKTEILEELRGFVATIPFEVMAALERCKGESFPNVRTLLPFRTGGFFEGLFFQIPATSSVDELKEGLSRDLEMPPRIRKLVLEADWGADGSVGECLTQV